MRIVIIDGQSGRLGAQLIEALRRAGLTAPHELIAIGTNALATSAMLKAGADQGATGENPVIVQCRTADVLVGPIGMVIADSLLGEMTPAMAVAIAQSPATRLLLPVNRCRSIVVGTAQKTRAQLVEEAVEQILQMCTN